MLIHFAVKDILADKELENLSKSTSWGMKCSLRTFYGFARKEGLPEYQNELHMGYGIL
ncbi:hypothetical protein SIN01_25670 [Sporolactobacillus inulinus]|nr:hypothetical protein SIN01_25670 [Sporolactobacillus inulinus]